VILHDLSVSVIDPSRTRLLDGREQIQGGDAEGVTRPRSPSNQIARAISSTSVSEFRDDAPE
jgi:hypothetical protein